MPSFTQAEQPNHSFQGHTGFLAWGVSSSNSVMDWCDDVPMASLETSSGQGLEQLIGRLRQAFRSPGSAARRAAPLLCVCVAALLRAPTRGSLAACAYRRAQQAAGAGGPGPAGLCPASPHPLRSLQRDHCSVGAQGTNVRKQDLKRCNLAFPGQHSPLR